MKDFIEERMSSMAARPLMYAGTTESFILLLVQLVEISWLDNIESFNSNDLMSELCGKELGCMVPNIDLREVDTDWGRSRVDIAKKYLRLSQ